MDKRATITILVGLGFFVVGIIGFVIGGFGVAGLEESTDFALEEVDNGTIYLKDSDGLGELGVTFWVKGKYLDTNDNGIWDVCDNVTITVTEKPGISDWGAYDGEFYNEVIANYDGQETSDCNADMRNKNLERAEQGYVKIGRACLGCFAGDFSFESNANVSVTYDDVLIEEVGEDIGMIAIGFLGGSGAVCCGVIIMFIGVILIFTLKDDAPVQMMVGADGSYMMASAPPNAVGVGVSQNIAQVTASTPIITQEVTQAEPYEFPATGDAAEATTPAESETKDESN
ncbi:MAG: hypothetical protein QGF34_02770 [Candidatus Poseidoniaceae archaeon]|nr:hypothetical protein [Candidatus Poseidoniaceae archaeon]